jgi:hypothetical protein
VTGRQTIFPKTTARVNSYDRSDGEKVVFAGKHACLGQIPREMFGGKQV